MTGSRQERIFGAQFPFFRDALDKIPMDFLNRWIVATLPLVPRSIVRKIADRYIAGETLREAVATVQRLNGRSRMATIDLLGEDVTDRAQTAGNLAADLEILRTIADLRLEANLSVKPTALGLKIDPDLCATNMRRLLKEAMPLGNFVRFEMEDSSCTEETLRVFRELRRECDNVGIVLQAYLRRSLSDLRALLRIPGLNLRLVKGVYVEPFGIAYGSRALVNRNYAVLLEEAMRAKAYVGIATHDEELVWEALRLIDRYALRPDQYEFQMLLGVGEALQELLLAGGHRVRVYVPFGREWYAYSLRRLRDNPRIAGYVLKDLFG